MIGLLAKKVGMTRVFDKEGRHIPITVLQAGPCHVTELKTKERDGYTAVQLGFDEVKEKRLTRPKLGQFSKRKLPPLRFVREIRTSDLEGLAVGNQVHVDIFQEGDFVDIQGFTIGKGFQGVVKRHHFRGGEKAHGTKMGREPGSIGSSQFPKRVIKGLRMSGHMGHGKQTTPQVRVVKVDSENHLLAVKGPVPGVEGSYLVIRSALKRGTPRKWKIANSAGTSSKEAPSQGKSSEISEESRKSSS